MGYGYDPEETTGQEHMDDTAPESGEQEYTDSAQKTDASDMSAYSGVSDDTSAYSSGSTGAADNAQNASDNTQDTSDNTQDTFNSASDAEQGAQPSRSRYEYQNYYNDRYRGDDSKQKYGYQPGVQQMPAPKKRDSAGKWIAVSALVVIFVCVCIGIGLIGVYSIRSANQLDSADLSALIDENGTVTAGEQEVTVKFLLPASVEQVNAVTVQVHLTQLAASNTDAQGDQ